MKKQYFFPVFLSVILTLVCCGCSDDATSPTPEADILFTATFDENYMSDGVDNRFIFVSDSDGQVLDVGSWSGAATVVLINSSIHPDTISVTTVQSRESSLSFYTQLAVAKGSSKSYTGRTEYIVPETAGITFLNAPRAESHLNASNGGTVTGQGNMPPSAQVYLQGGMSDFFARVIPLNSPPIGGWLFDLIPGDTDTLDFSDPKVVQPLIRADVRMPSGYTSLMCYLTKIDFDSPMPSNVTVDRQFFTGAVPGTATFYYPDIDLDQLRTTFLFTNFNNPRSYYTQDGMGALPSILETMEGQLSVANASVDSFSFIMEGPWDSFVSAWSQDAEIYSGWFVKGPSPVHSFALPQIPREISEMFPTVVRDDYELYDLSVADGTVQDGMMRRQGLFSIGNAAGKTHPQGWPLHDKKTFENW